MTNETNETNGQAPKDEAAVRMEEFQQACREWATRHAAMRTVPGRGYAFNPVQLALDAKVLQAHMDAICELLNIDAEELRQRVINKLAVEIANMPEVSAIVMAGADAIPLRRPQ